MTVVVVVAILGLVGLVVLFSLFARLGNWATPAPAAHPSAAAPSALARP